MVKKIVITGPESTGKSKLSEALAVHFNTLWCPEYAREYLRANGKDYTYADLAKIARGQLAKEEIYVAQAVTESKELVFIDTDMHVMKVWSEFVFGKTDPFIEQQLAVRHYDLYLLCDIDLPWEADELREHPEKETRKQLFNIYKTLLSEQATPWIVINGTGADRLTAAIKAVNTLLLI